MQMPSEMYDKEGDDGKTTGETFKEQSLDTIEKELLMRQHAEEYGISLTDEEKQQAKEAAQAFADKNGDDVMKKLHATVEDIQDALELYVIQTKIYDPIIADVDTEVSDEEAKQTSISYITVSTAGTEKDDDGKTIDLTDEEKAAKKEIAQRFLDLLKESEDPATASFTDLRKELNDQLNAENTADSTGSAVTPSAAFFFFISLPPARTALRSQTLSIPVIFFTNGDGVNSPSAVSSSSAEKVRYCQPYFSTSCRIPGSCAFRSILAACRTAFGEIPAAASAARTFSSIRPAGVFFLQPMPTVITFGIR